MRIGMGYDVHGLTENRKLIIGRVDIPYEEGLGFNRTGEGISAQAICLLTSPVSLGSEDVTTRGCSAGVGGCSMKG